MRSLVAAIVVMVLSFTAGMLFWGKPAPDGDEPNYQAVASANWYGFHELDCDDIDVALNAGQTCADEMQNINVAPTIRFVRRLKHGWTVVRIVVAERGGNRSTMDVTLNQHNEVVRAVPVAS